MNNGLRVWFFITLLSLSLFSCSHLKGPTYDAGDWSFKGKMAVRNSTEASSFNINWLQQAEIYTLELSGPLGQGAIVINGKPGDVSLTKNNQVFHSENLSQLVYETTEMDLPMEHLQYWVRARPYPYAAYARAKDANNQLETLSQSGWTVTYSAYFEQLEPLPRKLSFTNGTDSAKLIIREWKELPDQ